MVDENNRLTNEINEALDKYYILRNNVVTLHNNLEPRMRGVSGEVGVNSEQTQAVSRAIKPNVVSTLYF